jgi:hypothetical protein
MPSATLASVLPETVPETVTDRVRLTPSAPARASAVAAWLGEVASVRR